MTVIAVFCQGPENLGNMARCGLWCLGGSGGRWWGCPRGGASMLTANLRHLLLIAILSLASISAWAAVADDAPGVVRVRFAGGDTVLGTMEDQAKCFTNRGYALKNLPDELVGLTFTRRPGG